MSKLHETFGGIRAQNWNDGFDATPTTVAPLTDRRATELYAELDELQRQCDELTIGRGALARALNLCMTELYSSASHDCPYCIGCGKTCAFKTGAQALEAAGQPWEPPPPAGVSW